MYSICFPPLIVFIPFTNDKYSNVPELEIEAPISHLSPQDSYINGCSFLSKNNSQYFSKSLIKILQEPKNSLTKQYQELFKLDGAKLTFKENALKEIAQKAIKKKSEVQFTAHLFRNDNNVFVDVTDIAKIVSWGYTLSVSVGDLNNDGWLDIYVNNDFEMPDFA